MVENETLIIHNPASGIKDRSREVGEAANLLSNYVGRVNIQKTEGPRHATELVIQAREQGYAHIIVAGGDGTLREAAAGAVNSDMDITLWPTGSEEMGRRDLKMPRDLLQAVEVVLYGKVQLIDTGSINGEIFLFNAGIGADADVMCGVQKPGCKKDGYGPKVYLKQAMQILPKVRGVSAELTIDGERFSTQKLYQLWFNNGQRLARFPVTPGKIDDGRAEVILALADRMSELVFPVAATLVRRKNSNNCMFITATELDVSLGRKRRAQLDGDPTSLSDYFAIRINPKSLRIRVPDKMNVIYSRPAISK